MMKHYFSLADPRLNKTVITRNYFPGHFYRAFDENEAKHKLNDM